MLTKNQIKLLNELRVRYQCVRADIAADTSYVNSLSDEEYGTLTRNRINEERKFFSGKHGILIDEVIEMENAYNQLEDIDEYHQFLEYREICDLDFYKKLRNIIEQQVSADGKLGKSFVPSLMQSNGYRRWQDEVEKRVRRCTNALKRVIPQMNQFEYEDIKYGIQYRIDHDELVPQDAEREFIILLCEHALTKDYMNSKWKQFLSRLLDI